MNSEKQLTPLESLEVITSMIQQAKGNMKNTSFYFLLWGWTIVIANLGVYLLTKFTDLKNPYLVFSITIPAAIISVIYGIREGKRTSSSTLLDTISQWTWCGFGITCFIFAVFGRNIGWNINPVIITMCGMPTFISGIMLRFKPLMIGGIVFWVMGIISFLTDIQTQFLLAAFAVMFGYLIPGYMLRNSKS